MGVAFGLAGCAHDGDEVGHFTVVHAGNYLRVFAVQLVDESRRFRVPAPILVVPGQFGVKVVGTRLVGDHRGVLPAAGLGGTFMPEAHQHHHGAVLAHGIVQIPFVTVTVPIRGCVVLDGEHSMSLSRTRSAAPSAPVTP